MNEFEQYLAFHEIDLIHLSIEAKVRYLIVYNAKKGYPITLESAQKIQEAVGRMTGVPYNGSFTLMQLQTLPADLPTITNKRLPSNQRAVKRG